MAVDTVPADKTQWLATLIELESRVRLAGDTMTAAQIIVNDTRKLLVFRHAVLFKINPQKKWRVLAVSDVMDPNPGGPFLLWLTAFLHQWLPKEQISGNPPISITGSNLPDGHRQQWLEWLPPFGHWMPLLSMAGTPLGGVIWFGDTALSENEVWLLGHWSSSFGQSWERLLLLENRSCLWRLPGLLISKRGTLVTLIVLACAAFIPVHLTVLAPAQIVPREPVAISSPLTGIVAQIHVRPNQEVVAGTPLFSLEESELKNRHGVAVKTLEVESANLEKAQRKGFHDDRSRSEIALAQAMVAMKQAEAQFAAEQLALVNVRAPQDGVAVFNDPNQWLGQPVKVGETILHLANPAHTELEAWIPVADAITLEKGTKVFMFLNVHPHQPLAARLKMADFEARLAPEGFLGFRIRARFEGNAGQVRLGLRGSARVQGDRVRLWYYLLRRPLAYLRQHTGW